MHCEKKTFKNWSPLCLLESGEQRYAKATNGNDNPKHVMQENANHRSYTPSRFGHQLKTLERRQQGIKDHMPKELPQYHQNPPRKQASTPLIQFGAPGLGKKGTNMQTAADKKSYTTERIHKQTPTRKLDWHAHQQLCWSCSQEQCCLLLKLLRPRLST